MNVTAGLTAVAVVGAAFGFASPARAADDFSGTFIPHGPGLRSTWVVTPCGPDGTKCNNDGVKPGTVTFKVDAGRQEGTMTTTNPATGCPWAFAPGYSQPVFFTLTRI